MPVDLPTLGRSNREIRLRDAALCEIIGRGAPILGTLEDLDDRVATANNKAEGFESTGSRDNGDISGDGNARRSDWMASVPDQTEIVRMNIPGTHDTCTWNYTPELQESLKRYTVPIHDSRVYRCEQRSIFRMLNDGIRFFDLRYAWNPDLETIGFYHSKAMLSPTTRMEDALFGLYTWLDMHPTETILVSMNYEPGTGTTDNAQLQRTLYNILTGDIAKRYWVQTRGSLRTLGEARGKLILLQRFDFSLLPEHMTERFGIHLDPIHWTINGKNTELIYAEGKAAYIQDYYKIEPSKDSNPASCIADKLEVVKQHLERAIDPQLHPDQLYISFASALTPQVYALGDGERMLGVNQGLLPWLRQHKGMRLGIILLDFYDGVPELVDEIIIQPSNT